MARFGAYLGLRNSWKRRSMDEELRILKRVDLPAALDALDDRVMGALRIRRREAVAMRRIMALAAFVSLGGGMVAGSAVSQPAVAASPLSPFGPSSALAPSSLLDTQ
ncbi:hypothetical protein KNJ79_20625 (plasmid) [Sphingopyxis indica]|jgi:hypothetical protein|uniref:hypothetical protein n=2 Tax=Sphingopyxis TaxID=165697 RepID=UPI0013F7BCFE|nr:MULTISPECIES: hypothetical protein [Sphingopyxis]KAB2857901.1 MAG: hypothetical protein F9K41_02445 [Sphingopyxis terrae]WOF45801.1 hypothetical protein KNJ79_20625 [Sphingopyxis indica]